MSDLFFYNSQTNILCQVSTFKWVGSQYGTRTQLAGTVRQSILQLETNIPIAFMHTNWTLLRLVIGFSIPPPPMKNVHFHNISLFGDIHSALPLVMSLNVGGCSFFFVLGLGKPFYIYCDINSQFVVQSSQSIEYYLLNHICSVPQQ